MYTEVTVRCMDQVLQLTNTPRIASGDVEVVRVTFSFCSKWDGFGKTAVFYRDPETVYHALLVDDACLIPWEVLTEPGRLYFGVFGTKDGSAIRTSEVLTLIVELGALTVATAETREPTPDIYAQVLAELQRIRELTAASQAVAEAAETTATEALATASEAKTTAEGIALTASEAKTAASEAKTAAQQAAQQAAAAQTAADDAMPKSGGTFTGKIKAVNAITDNDAQMRNIKVCSSAGPTNENRVQTIEIQMTRK